MLGILRKKPIDKLIEVLGKSKVNTSLVERKLYSYDATPIPIERAMPSAVVFPESHEDVVKLVKVCYEENIPIFPRGAGSGLTGGAVPTLERGIVVSFERMNRFEVNVDNATAEVQPGVITSQFQEYVERLGLFYPPDPSSFKYSTLGGNMAENAGGPRCLKYGVTREYVLGLTAVIKEGHTLKTGNPIIKDVAGYDITKLFVGSEGTLGLITSATLKLIPKPKARATALALFKNLEDVGRAVTKIFTSGIFPSALEFMDSDAIRAVEDYKPVGLPKVEALLLIEVDGSPQSVVEDLKQIEELLRPMGVEVLVAKSKEEEEKLWSARKSLGPALWKVKVFVAKEDIDKGTPISKELFRVEERFMKSVPSDLRLSSEEFENFVASTRIVKGTMLRRSLLKEIPAVKAGDVVNAVFKSGAIEVVFQTIAIDTGSIGKVIRLKRDDGKVLRGKVISRGKVEVVP